MTDLEKLLKKSDFSKETNFKEALRDRLLAGGNVTRIDFGRELTDDELGFVNAAGKKSPADLIDQNKTEKP